MQTKYGHLTYCTNIHSGESWGEHFAALKEFIPRIKEAVSTDQPFGIGLRLSNRASLDLEVEQELDQFQKWLMENDCYVFTLNGFPFGGFHRVTVKDDVHTPDWTTKQRVDYTKRLFNILAQLVPNTMNGGISTSPLSYKHWHGEDKKEKVFTSATHHILEVVKHLIELKNKTGQSLHLDIEPEPDGLLESGAEFIDWYQKYLLAEGLHFLKEHFNYTVAEAEAAIKEHIQLCYDICHFAVGYEDHEQVIQQLNSLGIKTGKIQISAALKAALTEGESRKSVIEAFTKFNESTYLHQVVARQHNGGYIRYPDLPQALADASNPNSVEWRSHFHVPLFIKEYGTLQSTQDDITTVLNLHKHAPFTSHLEIETYTWEVLPDKLKLHLDESIVRELLWVKKHL